MPMPASAQTTRALDVLVTIPVYRSVGSRPSQVYVDDRHFATDQPTANRLRDLVYERIEAQPGDQIHEREGATVLVTADGRWFPITLVPPSPLDPGTAFHHAAMTAREDRALAEGLIAEGRLIEGKLRRVKGMSTRAEQRQFSERDPLLVN